MGPIAQTQRRSGLPWRLVFLAALAASSAGCSLFRDFGPFVESDGGGVDACAAAGTCSCEPRHASCDSDETNGCETDLDTDAQHCGACNFACAGTLACQGGQCQQAAGRLVLSHRSSCALLEPADANDARPVVCWGSNISNQLRDLTLGTAPEDYRASAAPIPGVDLVRDIAIGHGSIGDGPSGISHVCALDDVTEVATCWGDNSSEQLGVTGTVGLDELRTVDLTGAVALAAGAMHTCALLIGGQIRCWGDNSADQIGNSTAPSPSGYPRQVDGIDTATQIAADLNSTCARLASGEVWCWGGLSGTTPTPIEDPAGNPLNDAQLVDIGGAGAFGSHGCAVRSNGRVSCWGTNYFGELGNGVVCDPFQMTCPGQEPAQEVLGLQNAIDVSTGSTYSCALIDSGQVYCWGRNRSGELIAGNDTNPILTPTPVPGLDNVIDIEGGGVHTCARRRSGQVVCFGENLVGELGDGTALTRVGFVEVVGLP